MIDYRVLLKKYIMHVARIECTTLLEDYHKPHNFPGEEWAELQKLDAETLEAERDLDAKRELTPHV